MSDTASQTPGGWRTVFHAALLAAGLLAAAALIRSMPLGEQHALLSGWVIGRGWRGIALFIAAGGLGCALGIPRQAIAFAAGSIAGAAGGTALALPAELIGCALNLVWAGAVARDWTARRLNGRLARLSGPLTRHPFTATLTLRLLPIGSNIALNILAGMLAIPALPYLAASALGYLPQTLIFALLGSGAVVAEGTRIGIGIALFVASALLGLVLLRRHREMA
jgi:uncharacterized membrane protein YdjX (TVP38/TMEM64 family)